MIQIPMHKVLSNSAGVKIELLRNKLCEQQKISLSVLRLDQIHPIVSGNKIFKLYYFLEEAMNASHRKIVTFGGAYSNHLAATAQVCKENGLQCIGIIRGEAPQQLSHTLSFCRDNGMHLEFFSRSRYKAFSQGSIPSCFQEKFGDHTLVPEGGFSLQGRDGAALIGAHGRFSNYSHICCAIGTATTFAGLMMCCGKDTDVMGFSVLKNQHDLEERLSLLQVPPQKNYKVFYEYHFGGYAKKNDSLIDFMNSFYANTQIPIDFVYTAKMMFGVCDLVGKKYFPPGSNILCLHTGGLQGNHSLPPGLLNF